jgi:outer membrane protein, heavy metal efflux system
MRYESPRFSRFGGAALALAALLASSTALAEKPTPLLVLLNESLRQSPEIAAAQARAAAAAARIAPAGALDDPMAETGIVNAPLAPFSLRREEMTMQMLGLSQRLPFPGKRGLRTEVARGDAAALEATALDARDQVLREIRMNYEELAATDAERAVVESMRATLEEYVTVAETRYGVGAAAQTDVLQAETQLARVRQQLLELVRRRFELQAALAQLTGRGAGIAPVGAAEQRLQAAPPTLETLLAGSVERPRAAALAAEAARARSQVALMQREFYPDFDVKLSYGRRERAPDGMPRDDMISLTLGVNLPVWRRQRLDPQVAEARAMVTEREAMLNALRLETRAQLTQRHALATQARQSVALYDATLLPAATAAVNSAEASYRVGRVDFLTLLETRMRLFEAQMARVAAVAEHNRALADLDYLAGRPPAGVEAQP